MEALKFRIDVNDTHANKVRNYFEKAQERQQELRLSKIDPKIESYNIAFELDLTEYLAAFDDLSKTSETRSMIS